MPPMEVLGPPHHGSQGQGVLSHSVQRVPGGHKGGPLPTTIFTVVVNSMIRNWIMVVSMKEVEENCFVGDLHRMATISYVNNGHLSYMRLE